MHLLPAAGPVHPALGILGPRAEPGADIAEMIEGLARPISERLADTAGIELVGVSGLVERLRMIKDDGEVALLRRACAIGDDSALRRATQDDPSWLNRPVPPVFAPAFVAITRRPR